MILSIFVILLSLPIAHTNYESRIAITPSGYEFQLTYSIQLLVSTTAQTIITCSAACNQLASCRTFDFDSVSKRCRLFEADGITTGSIIVSSSLTSRVGTVQISSDLYSSTHNQPCTWCQMDRYETCSANTSTCQCPRNSYWDGSVCALQLFQNNTCKQQNACRSDLNLTCAQDCSGIFTKCVSASTTNTTQTSAGYGVTFVGTCSGSSVVNQITLTGQNGITMSPNGMLYVADGANRVVLFSQSDRVGTTVQSYGSWPAFVFYDNRTSLLYATVMQLNLVYIYPTNKTIPPNGISYNNCSLQWLYRPSGIVVDSTGNVYISSYMCHWITKWAPNATTGILIAGSATGTLGSTSTTMSSSMNMALDEANSVIYVADRFNNRVQRFPLNGMGIGVTVAGGNGLGFAPNQLSQPTDVYLSKSKTVLYIADNANNRIQKWVINASMGTTIAGSAMGIAGSSTYLLNSAYALTVDSTETYLYVSDSNNNRIQRFPFL
ncbi:unnamed protein product [Adineta ricciae]|uniref:Apple domain-containing protein n=1 Tax=Adineta ricciae TaxID=249248 RepID=A0A814AEF4_ADIRI|nr:unnamed protein product [Adineta ricciae]